MGLGDYEGKRNFSRTPEPSPQLGHEGGPLIFVVQKHAARSLHYDFRLEVGGVLKSWSVPKGPSLDPEMKHLAVMVEDHPLDYASFEGTIPRGEYGAGEVIVWDKGTYSPDEGGRLLFHDRALAEAEMEQALERGKLSIFLRGHKLKGSWTLVKLKRSDKNWLLMKHQDEYAQPGIDILKEERSVLSGLTVDDLKMGHSPPPTITTPLNPAEIPGARLTPFPPAIAPMLASLADAPFSNPDWVFEPKLDGYRVLAYIRSGEVTLLSRRGLNVTQQYSTLKLSLSRQPASEMVLDGEIIAMDERGRLCFQCLQQYLRSLQLAEDTHSEIHLPLIYYVFDILYLDGYDLRDATLRHRKGLLHGILRPTEQVRLVDYFEGEGETVYSAAINNGLEGVIAKRIESRYESGKRSRDWLKVEAMSSDEFIIGGYTRGEGSRARTFGALLLGYLDDRDKLVFAGHVGSGFDERTLVELRNRLDALSTDQCPFAEVPPLNAPATWVKPELVAEVKFSQWTQDGRLRIPIFLRLRDDKSPSETRKTEVVSASPRVEKAMQAATVARESIDSVLEQLRNPKDSLTIEIEENRIKLNNLDKVLWPPTDTHPALSKRDLLIYLARVSPYFLSHLKDRPLSLSRYPDGIYGEHFYQKHWSSRMPDFVTRVNLRSDEGDSLSEYLMCDNLATLLWLGQLANIEFHTWFSRVSPEPDALEQAKTDVEHLLAYPDFIIFDLDPYIYSGQEPAGAEPELNRKAFARVCEAALWLKEILDRLSLASFVKTSGKTGLHVYVPVIRQLEYCAVRSAAETIGRFLVQQHPDDITLEWVVERRKGKVFVDYNQNVRGKTLAAAYSPRPTPQASVSTPLRWDELGKIYPADFSILTLPDRLKETGDLWADILKARRDLKGLLGANSTDS